MSFCSAQRKLLTEPLFSLQGFPPTYFGTVTMSPMPVALLQRPGSHRAECLMSGASLLYRHGQSPCSPSWWTAPAAHVTTPPSLHSHTSVVAGIHSDIFSHCHWCGQFCNRQLLLHFSSNGSYSFPHPAAAVAQGKGNKTEQMLKGGTWNSTYMVPLVSSRKKWV